MASKSTAHRRRGAAKLENAGVVVIAALLVVTVGGVWQRSGFDDVVSQALCAVHATTSDHPRTNCDAPSPPPAPR